MKIHSRSDYWSSLKLLQFSGIDSVWMKASRSFYHWYRSYRFEQEKSRSTFKWGFGCRIGHPSYMSGNKNLHHSMQRLEVECVDSWNAVILVDLHVQLITCSEMINVSIKICGEPCLLVLNYVIFSLSYFEDRYQHERLTGKYEEHLVAYNLVTQLVQLRYLDETSLFCKLQNVRCWQ